MIRQSTQTPANCGSQNENAKPCKAEIAAKIARLVRREGLDYEDWRYVSRRVRQICDLRPPKKRKRLPNVLAEDAFRTFYEVVDRAGDAQHALMLRLLFYTSVRVSEFVNIAVTDVDPAACKIRVNNGKGGKDRFVLFGRSFAIALRTHIVAHPKNRFLFQSSRNTKFSTRRIQQIVKSYAIQAGVDATPHTFRHQAITWLTKAGLADAELQLITGHAHRNTLQIYQHVAIDGSLGEKYQEAAKQVTF